MFIIQRMFGNFQLLESIKIDQYVDRTIGFNRLWSDRVYG